MANLDSTYAAQLVNVSLGGASTVTAPIMARLMTVNGTPTTLGTQVSGGSYAP